MNKSSTIWIVILVVLNITLLAYLFFSQNNRVDERHTKSRNEIRNVVKDIGFDKNQKQILRQKRKEIMQKNHELIELKRNWVMALVSTTDSVKKSTLLDSLAENEKHINSHIDQYFWVMDSIANPEQRVKIKKHMPQLIKMIIPSKGGGRKGARRK